ncbi:DUF6796 family protein [Saccharomonospora sp. NPDC046836]|uniref:DUF6796 family protein n=1 Tax=Saccharomonospora sp. NPDC046836 TaxID=3156921 RepID=UPI00340ABCE3
MKRRNMVRATGLAGVAAAAAYAVSDVLLLGRKADPEKHPALQGLEDVNKPLMPLLSMVPASTNRLAAGALTGVYATPLYLAAAWHVYQGLAPAGQRKALPPSLLLAAGLAWTSFTHGSFFHIGRIYQDLDALGEDARARERLLATAKAFERATVSAYVPLGVATVAASGLIIDAIRRGNTAYPRWSGPLVAPLAPIVAATALTATNILPGRARYALQGAGVNLGSIISLGASTVLLWRNRRAGTA